MAACGSLVTTPSDSPLESSAPAAPRPCRATSRPPSATGSASARAPAPFWSCAADPNSLSTAAFVDRHVRSAQ
eukprot:1690837-Prymnesium_polylepis.3